MSDADNIRDVDMHYFNALMHIKNWAVECFSKCAKDAALDAKTAATEERVRAQGGI